MNLPKRKKVEECKYVSDTELHDRIEALVRDFIGAPDDASVWYDGEDHAWTVDWKRDETDDEYDRRCAKWLKNADKRAIADAKRKARLAEQRLKDEERERKELARLSAKYGLRS